MDDEVDTDGEIFAEVSRQAREVLESGDEPGVRDSEHPERPVVSVNLSFNIKLDCDESYDVHLIVLYFVVCLEMNKIIDEKLFYLNGSLFEKSEAFVTTCT